MTKVKFWGTRGSIPTPGKKTMKYGGNTSCVEIRHKEGLFICDSGTGIRELGESLMKEFAGKPIEADLFISHTHWDHIQGFPFFVPAYIPKNRLRVISGKSVGDSFENIFRGQMGQNYFPVEVGDMQAKLEFLHAEEEAKIGSVTVRSMFTNHPGVDVAYRFEFGKSSVVYLTDHESHRAVAGESDVTDRQDKMVVDFCKGADLLIADSQYTDNEYETKKGWGHSRWRDSLALSLEADVKRFALFHHDPTRSDEALDAIVEECRAEVKKAKKPLEVFGAAENAEVELP